MRLALIVMLLTTCGCARGLFLSTRNEVAITTPIKGSITMNLAASTPEGSGGPVQAMPVDGGPACKAGPKVAIIDVDGVLVNHNLSGPLFAGDNPVAIFQEKLDATRADPDVCAVVLRINSPGGGVTACDVIRQMITKYRTTTRRPVVACIVDVGAGGAYYLATAADTIVAHPTAITGGIGVIWNSYNLRDFMAQFNVVPQTIKAGPNIDMGSANNAIPAETKLLLQQMADEYHQRFRSVVQGARPKLDGENNTTFDGRVFTANQALQRGLIDSLGYLDDAIEQAKKLSDQTEARVVMYQRPTNPAFASYAEKTNHIPTQSLLPIRVPGLERSRLPTFLYLWQPEPTMDRP
jgi:protease IV